MIEGEVRYSSTDTAPPEYYLTPFDGVHAPVYLHDAGVLFYAELPACCNQVTYHSVCLSIVKSSASMKKYSWCSQVF